MRMPEVIEILLILQMVGIILELTGRVLQIPEMGKYF